MRETNHQVEEILRFLCDYNTNMAAPRPHWDDENAAKMAVTGCRSEVRRAGAQFAIKSAISEDLCNG